MKTSGFRCKTKFRLLVFLGHPNGDHIMNSQSLFEGNLSSPDLSFHLASSCWIPGKDNFSRGYLMLIVSIAFCHTRCFLTVPPDFQFQNEKQVEAHQSYFLRNKIQCKKAPHWLSKFFFFNLKLKTMQNNLKKNTLQKYDRYEQKG